MAYGALDLKMFHVALPLPYDEEQILHIHDCRISHAFLILLVAEATNRIREACDSRECANLFLMVRFRQVHDPQVHNIFPSKAPYGTK